MSEVQDVERRLEHLEREFARYRERVKYAVEERDRRALNEARSFSSLIIWAPFAAIWYLSSKWFGDDWLPSFLSGIVGLLATGAFGSWIAGLHIKEDEKLPELPE